jgi:hypothetical protein
MNPADTLLPLAEASKEASLDFWGTWLVIATLVVIAGLVIEYIPDFYERLEHSKWKRWFVIPGAVGVVLGVVGEGITEFKALRTEGALRSIVHEEDDVQALAIASVNARAKEAERETALTKLQEAKVERLLSGKLELDAVGLDKLRTYSGTPVFVETTPSSLAFMLFRGRDDATRWSDAEHFATTFVRLEIYAGWKYNRVPDDPHNWPTHEGLTLLTWASRPFQRDIPEQRAFDAAEALRCLIIDRLGIWPHHHEATVLPEYPSLPKNGVLIEVGNLRPEDELNEAHLNAESEDCKNGPKASQ